MSEVVYYLEHPTGETVEGGWTVRIYDPIYREIEGRWRVFDGDLDEIGILLDELTELTVEEYDWLHYDGISWETPEEFQKEVGRTIHWLMDHDDPIELATYRKCVFWSVRFGGSFEEHYGRYYNLDRIRRNHFGY